MDRREWLRRYARRMRFGGIAFAALIAALALSGARQGLVVEGLAGLVLALATVLATVWLFDRFD